MKLACEATIVEQLYEQFSDILDQIDIEKTTLRITAEIISEKACYFPLRVILKCA